MEAISKRLLPLLGLKSLALVCQPEAVSALLKKVDIEGSHLETLTVGWIPGSVMPFDANQWHDVLSKLKSFTVPTGSSWLSREFCVIALSSFRNLESLEWGGALLDITTAKRIQESVKWQFTLRHLRTQDVLLYTFPSSVLQTLTTMKLLGTRRDRDTTTTITLPNLTDLCPLGTWRHLLRIQAPKLEYLQLRACGILPLTALIPQLIRTQLRPSRLETEEITSSSLVEALITGPFRDITELNVQVEVAQRARSSSLVKLICHGSDVDGSIFCPRLRHLVVMLSGLGTTDYHSELNDAIMDALNRRGPEAGEVLSVRLSVAKDLAKILKHDCKSECGILEQEQIFLGGWLVVGGEHYNMDPSILQQPVILDQTKGTDGCIDEYTDVDTSARPKQKRRRSPGGETRSPTTKRAKKAKSPNRAEHLEEIDAVEEASQSILVSIPRQLNHYQNSKVDSASGWAQQYHIDLPGAEVYYQENFIGEDTANEWYEQLTRLDTWYRPTLSLYGKPYVQSRSIASYVTSPHLTARYSGHSVKMNHPYPALLVEIQNRVSEVLGVGFDHVMLNWYQDGSVHIGKHRDTKENQVIASLSLGSQRTFVFHPHISKGEKRVDEEPKRWPLRNGSLLVMQGDTQENWK
ncbi:hypothetical protein FRC17_006302, partial [Serendipita sp. 399]